MTTRLKSRKRRRAETWHLPFAQRSLPQANMRIATLEALLQAQNKKDPKAETELIDLRHFNRIGGKPVTLYPNYEVP